MPRHVCHPHDDRRKTAQTMATKQHTGITSSLRLRLPARVNVCGVDRAIRPRIRHGLPSANEPYSQSACRIFSDQRWLLPHVAFRFEGHSPHHQHAWQQVFHPTHNEYSLAMSWMPLALHRLPGLPDDGREWHLDCVSNLQSCFLGHPVVLEQTARDRGRCRVSR